MAERHDGIGFTFRARLEQTVQIPCKPKPGEKATKGTDQRMNIVGKLYPEPYVHHEAARAFYDRMAPLISLGWRIVAVQIKAYDEADV